MSLVTVDAEGWVADVAPTPAGPEAALRAAARRYVGEVVERDLAALATKVERLRAALADAEAEHARVSERRDQLLALLSGLGAAPPQARVLHDKKAAPPASRNDGLYAVVEGVLADGRPHDIPELRAAALAAGLDPDRPGRPNTRLYDVLHQRRARRVSRGLWQKGAGDAR